MFLFCGKRQSCVCIGSVGNDHILTFFYIVVTLFDFSTCSLGNQWNLVCSTDGRRADFTCVEKIMDRAEKYLMERLRLGDNKRKPVNLLANGFFFL